MFVTRTTAVGVFENRTQAQQAIQELKRIGFTESQIGMTGRHDADGTDDDDGDTYATEGGMTGLAAGAGVGALWGLGIIAGILPAIGPAIAGGTLAAILSSAAAGAAAAGLAGTLIGLGIPKDEAEYYEEELKAGRFVVTVQAGDRYDEAVSILRQFGSYDALNRTPSTSASTVSNSGHAAWAGAPVNDSSSAMKGSTCDRMDAEDLDDEGQTFQEREEVLHVRKEPVKTGEVRVRKEVHTEQKTLEVPVSREEIVIERTAASGHGASSGPIEEEEIRIPVTEEQVHLEKETVVKNEVRVGKRAVQDTKHVQGTVRREELHVDTEGDADVRDDR